MENLLIIFYIVSMIICMYAVAKDLKQAGMQSIDIYGVVMIFMTSLMPVLNAILACAILIRVYEAKQEVKKEVNPY